MFRRVQVKRMMDGPRTHWNVFCSQFSYVQGTQSSHSDPGGSKNCFVFKQVGLQKYPGITKQNSIAQTSSATNLVLLISYLDTGDVNL
jgi:hypothetical protein